VTRSPISPDSLTAHGQVDTASCSLTYH